jgi:hypothetical protein
MQDLQNKFGTFFGGGTSQSKQQNPTPQFIEPVKGQDLGQKKVGGQG